MELLAIINLINEIGKPGIYADTLAELVQEVAIEMTANSAHNAAYYILLKNDLTYLV